MHVDKLTLLLGGNLSFGLDVGEQPLVGFRGDVLADEGGRHQDDLDAGLLRRIDHRGDVLLVLRQILLVGGQRFSVGIPEVLPHVVDADGDDHISRLVLHHVLVEPRHEVLGPLTAHARVDHLGKFHAGILLGQHGVDDADKSGIPVAAFARDRIADGDNLLAALELELLGGIGRGRANQGQYRGKQLDNPRRHFLISFVARVQVLLRRPRIADSFSPHILLSLPRFAAIATGDSCRATADSIRHRPCAAPYPSHPVSVTPRIRHTPYPSHAV